MLKRRTFIWCECNLGLFTDRSNHDDQDVFTLVPPNIDVDQNKLAPTAGDEDICILPGITGFGICIGLVLVVSITIILYKRFVSPGL